jgi:subtilisin family serine protease
MTNLVPVRVLDCAGSGSYASVISGLDWISANYRAGDAAVVNMSLGGPVSSTLDGAVRNLIAKGVSVVVAAGNSSADACKSSPSGVLEAVTVGSTSSNDYRSSFSNFGTCLDLFAPGTSITSTWLGANGTNTISGTSMASPHVAGAIARFIGSNPGLTPAQIAYSVTTSASAKVISAGTGSTNKLLFSNITPNTSAPVVTPTPVYKKVNPRGKR